jgi:peroxiredoxin Q/BCP
VLGMSTDSIQSHAKFARKFSLQFPLLSDAQGRVCQLYGIAKTSSKGEIRARRVTFLIDEAGLIERIWDPVKASEHNKQVLEFLQTRKSSH